MATRRIETEVVLSGEKQFNDGMKAINNNLKNLDAEMRVVSTSFDENASASDKLRAKQNILNQQIDQQKEKVRALNEMYEKQKTELGEDSAAADKYRRETLNAQAALNKMESALRDTEKELENVAEAEKKAASEAWKADHNFDATAASLKKIWNAAKTVGGALGTVSKKLLETGLAAAKLGAKTTLTGIAGLGAAAGAASIGLAALSAKGFKSLVSMSLEAANSEWSFWRLRNSLSGLSSAAEDAKSGLAEIMAPALESFAKKATVLLKDYNKEIEKAEGDTEAMGRIMADYLRRGAELIRDEAPAFIKAGGGLVKGLTSGIIENEEELENVAGELIGQITDFLDENADDMGKAAAVLVSALGRLVGKNAPALMDAGFSMIEALLNGLDLDNAENAGEQVGALVADLLLMLIGLAPDLAEAGLAFVGGLIDGVAEAWPDITEKFSTSKDELIAKAKEWYENWKGVGAEWVKGILQGIKDEWSELTSWIGGQADMMWGTSGADVSAPMWGGRHSADGLNYVPYNGYPVTLHEGEMVAPKPLASALRAAGINKNSRSLDGLQSGAVSVNNKVVVEFTGSLAQLGRVLQPYIKAEEQRRGPQLVK